MTPWLSRHLLQQQPVMEALETPPPGWGHSLWMDVLSMVKKCVRNRIEIVLLKMLRCKRSHHQPMTHAEGGTKYWYGETRIDTLAPNICLSIYISPNEREWTFGSIVARSLFLYFDIPGLGFFKRCQSFVRIIIEKYKIKSLCYFRYIGLQIKINKDK